MPSLLNLEGLTLPRDAIRASKLESSQYILERLPDTILWDKVGTKNILRLYGTQIYGILAKIGWVEGAFISVVNVQQFYRGRAKWSLDGVEKQTDFLPLYNLVFPLDADCLKSKVPRPPRSY